ncbi:MAG TPA: hypothetical protein DD939_15795 [Sulfitobacter pontiacus]|nr:hypothetical protein [Roseobacter sp.]OUT35651.1 MAG: hypothetical protein CBB63_14235 [Sulfitobacter sp. TMED3]HBR38743.1 hypothetical protein [Sulfitobacter pontiacus]|tara:strand:- start:338 stop:694 length:357 start_codon:yes stop_codon:yes gene_type:complete
MQFLRTTGQAAFAMLLCVAVLLWSVVPTSSHVPAVLDVLQENEQMILDHGHSHGLEEDLAWAMHGHSHDSADHDHSQAVVLAPEPNIRPVEVVRAAWRLSAASANISRVYSIERPPRA